MTVWQSKAHKDRGGEHRVHQLRRRRAVHPLSNRTRQRVPLRHGISRIPVVGIFGARRSVVRVRLWRGRDRPWLAGRNWSPGRISPSRAELRDGRAVRWESRPGPGSGRRRCPRRGRCLGRRPRCRRTASAVAHDRHARRVDSQPARVGHQLRQVGEDVLRQGCTRPLVEFVAHICCLSGPAVLYVMKTAGCGTGRVKDPGPRFLSPGGGSQGPGPCTPGPCPTVRCRCQQR